ncbi:hypothetical protein SAMCCGM7_pC0061 (plasmid) [Sinorhizobium americanum CCGM7]|nr:hypothetical protein SAMCCGM7_pC0061 [Sinorhizobium americanum CCGM7]
MKHPCQAAFVPLRQAKSGTAGTESKLRRGRLLMIPAGHAQRE